jgi:hypothetical protein
MRLPPGGFIRIKARTNRMNQDNSKRIAPIRGVRGYSKVRRGKGGRERGGLGGIQKGRGGWVENKWAMEGGGQTLFFVV